MENSAVYKSRGEASIYNMFVYYLQPLARLIMVGIAIFLFPSIYAMIMITFLQMAVSAIGLYVYERRRRSRAARR